MARRISGRTFVVGATVAAVGLVAEAAVTWVRRETPPAWAPATTALATVLFAGVNAMFEKGREEVPPRPPVYHPGYGYVAAPRPASRAGFGIAGVLVVVLLLCGVGGWIGATYLPKAVIAVSNSVRAPWNRPLGARTERLASHAVHKDHGLTFTITGVGCTRARPWWT